MEIGGFKIREQNEIHFLTFTVVQWIDVFTRNVYKEIILESLRYCQKEKGLIIHAWVVMSNHIHLIVRVKEPHRLSDVIRDFKKFTSVKIIKEIKTNLSESRRNWMLWIFESKAKESQRNENYQFWQHTSHPILCDSGDILETRLHYIHNNPVRAEIVEEPEHYIYSSAKDYYTGKKGLLDIDKLDF